MEDFITEQGSMILCGIASIIAINAVVMVVVAAGNMGRMLLDVLIG